MSKIKILQIIGSSKIGGGEKALCSLLKYLDKTKFSVFVACPAGGRMFEDFRRYAAEVRTFDFRNWLNPVTIISLKRYMQERQIDIVHTHIYNADFMGLIAAALAGVRIKIATIHGHNFFDINQFSLRGVKNFCCSFLYRIVYIFSDRIITVCQALKQDLVTRPGIKVAEGKISVIHNGVDLEELTRKDVETDRRLEGILTANGQRFIGVVANLDRAKGHRVLLKAIPDVIKNFKNVKFLFVGEGEEKAQLMKLAKKNEIEKAIIFVGAVQDIVKVISSCELIVLPSLSEGLPLVIMEAFYLEKPVIASRVGGVAELIKENETGILVSPYDHDELSKAILTVLKNKRLALEFGRKGKEIVYDKFQAREMVNQTDRFYQTLLSVYG